MKKRYSQFARLFLLAGMIQFLITVSFAQDDVVRETRDLPSFSGIKVGGAFEVTLTQGSPQKVEVEAKAKYIQDISTRVESNTIIISSKGIKNNTPLNIFITVPSVERIEVHGAAELNSANLLKADNLEIEASGAAEAKLELEVNTLKSDVSGAAELTISGNGVHHKAMVSGAAELHARDFNVKFTEADVSGAGSANVNTENLVGNTSGAGEIYDKDHQVERSATRSHDDVIVSRDDESDTTYVRIPGTAIVISEGEDSVRIRIGNRVLVVDDDGDIHTHKYCKPRFNGDWAGFGIGFNGYVNPDFNMNFPKMYEYMDLRMEKSIAVNINFLEQNIPLSKNQHWGIVTGLGLGFNDYRFSRPTRLSMDSSYLVGYLDEGISIRKSKLSAMYLTLPVLFEFQTAPIYHKDGFHISAGMIIAARLSSHTKKYYNELNKEFDVTKYNPETGLYETVYTAMSPNFSKAHEYNDWFLQPFKFDATVRIGWNFLNFFATYSVNSMFRKDKGPELYPWSAGITIAAW